MSSTSSPPPSFTPPKVSSDEQVHRVELVISTLLRVGVVISVLLIVVGSIVSFIRHPSYVTSTDDLARLVHPGAVPIHSFRDVPAGLSQYPGQSIVTVGLLVLIATPMMRVGVSIAAFFLERDWVYTLITSVVFCLLMLSLVLGAAE